MVAAGGWPTATSSAGGPPYVLKILPNCCSFMVLLALLFGLVNRLLECRHCGDRRRIQRVLAQVTPDGGRIERMFNSAKIDFKTILGRADLVDDAQISIMPRSGTAVSGRRTTDANVRAP